VAGLCRQHRAAGTASGGRITPITDWPVYADP
jgi:hypothetical protein